MLGLVIGYRGIFGWNWNGRIDILGYRVIPLLVELCSDLAKVNYSLFLRIGLPICSRFEISWRSLFIMLLGINDRLLDSFEW